MEGLNWKLVQVHEGVELERARSGSKVQMTRIEWIQQEEVLRESLCLMVVI
jgi:hypothetical protein